MKEKEVKDIQEEIIDLLKKYDLNYSRIVYLLRDLEEKLASRVYIN